MRSTKEGKTVGIVLPPQVIDSPRRLRIDNTVMHKDMEVMMSWIRVVLHEVNNGRDAFCRYLMKTKHGEERRS